MNEKAKLRTHLYLKMAQNIRRLYCEFDNHCIVADSDLAAKDVHGHKDAKLYWANCTGQVIDTAFTIKHKSSKTKNTTDVGVVMAKFSYEAAKKNNVDRGSGFIRGFK